MASTTTLRVELVQREDTNFRQWTALGGELRPKQWSKRRAMYWGLLLATERDGAYAHGRSSGRQLGPSDLVESGADLETMWFPSKAVVAELFDVVRHDERRIGLAPKAADPWAPVLVEMAACLRQGTVERVAADLPAAADSAHRAQ